MRIKTGNLNYLTLNFQTASNSKYCHSLELIFADGSPYAWVADFEPESPSVASFWGCRIRLLQPNQPILDVPGCQLLIRSWCWPKWTNLAVLNQVLQLSQLTQILQNWKSSSSTILNWDFDSPFSGSSALWASYNGCSLWRAAPPAIRPNGSKCSCSIYWKEFISKFRVFKSKEIWPNFNSIGLNLIEIQIWDKIWCLSKI